MNTPFKGNDRAIPIAVLFDCHRLHLQASCTLQCALIIAIYRPGVPRAAGAGAGVGRARTTATRHPHPVTPPTRPRFAT